MANQRRRRKTVTRTENLISISMSNKDMISNLPDSILSEILSFLPINEAVKTSVLSKRWKNIYRSIPTLDFTNLKQRSAVRFIDIVYYVLLSREANAQIRSFCIRTPQHASLLPSVTNWVSLVIRLRVEYLSLQREKTSVQLPLAIFTSRTLVILDLKGFKIEGFSSSVRVPSLKTLKFRDILFSNFGDFVLLLAGCPILEDLQLIGIDFTYKKESALTKRESSVQLPSLKTLCLKQILFSNVRDFVLLLAGCPILKDLELFSITFVPKKVSALIYRECRGLSLSKLNKATIGWSDFHFPLKALHNVDYLLFKIGKLYRRKDFIPIFHNLTVLDLFLHDYNLDSFVELLQHCPKLKILKVGMIDMDDMDGRIKDDQKKCVEPKFVPQCLSLQLRHCHLSYFSGLGGIMLAKYILKNARVLQTMHFTDKGKTKIKGLLSSYPRASAKCKLTFAYLRC